MKRSKSARSSRVLVRIRRPQNRVAPGTLVKGYQCDLMGKFGVTPCKYWALGKPCKYKPCKFVHTGVYGWRKVEEREHRLIELASQQDWEGVKRHLSICPDDVTIRSQVGSERKSVLVFAVVYNNLEMTKFIMGIAEERHHNLFANEDNPCNTILHTVARYGHIELAKYLLRQQGVHEFLKFKNSEDETPSMRAENYGKLEMAAFLKELENSPITLAQSEAIKRAIEQHDNSCKIKDIRLMFLGEGRSGKSSTIRSFMNEKFQPDSESTQGAEIFEVNVHIATSEWCAVSSDDIEGSNHEAEAVVIKAMEALVPEGEAVKPMLPLALVVDAKAFAPSQTVKSIASTANLEPNCRQQKHKFRNFQEISEPPENCKADAMKYRQGAVTRVGPSEIAAIKNTSVDAEGGCQTLGPSDFDAGSVGATALENSNANVSRIGLESQRAVQTRANVNPSQENSRGSYSLQHGEDGSDKSTFGIPRQNAKQSRLIWTNSKALMCSDVMMMMKIH